MKQSIKPAAPNAVVGHAAPPDHARAVEAQGAEAQVLAAAMPFNAGKAREIGRDDSIAPSRGATPAVAAPLASASTLSESNLSAKTGEGSAARGRSASSGALDAVRSDAAAQPMTTNQGVLIGDNQNSLKAGLVGLPVLMGDGESPGHTVVLSAGMGYRLRAAALKAEFDLGGPTTLLLLRYIQALIAQLGQTVACTRHHSLERRLCRFLLSTLDRLDGRTDFAMTQELMGGVLGVRREGVTEAALKLQRAGLLAYQRGHVTVLDRAGLKHRSCECHNVVGKEFLRLLPVQWGQ